MKEWLNETEALTLKGQIAVPYTWWAGETGSEFLLALKERQTITGARCPRCGVTFVPPRKNCGRCFVPIEERIDLSGEGVVTAHAKVHFEFGLQPAKPPFAYALIRLDGADVDLLHIVKKDLDRLKNGVRVKAVFRTERQGHILDVDAFEIIPSTSEV